MAIEFELKYCATPQVLAQVREDLGGRWEEIQMRTTYYDAPDGSLSARKWTLRRRLENGISICTLKTPASQGRQEYEVGCEDIGTGIVELCKLGAPAELQELTADGVEEVCGAAFTRRARTLQFPGFTAEIALDQGVLFSGENQRQLCELEVELKSGDGREMQMYAQLFAARYGLEPERKSKFKRSLELRR